MKTTLLQGHARPVSIRAELRRAVTMPLLAGSLFLLGCTSPGPHAAPGDGTTKMTHAERLKASGWLQVFSEQAWARKAGGGPTSFEYSEYKILTPEGKFVMQVDNGGPMDEPSTVRVAPGRYLVVAQAYKRGTVRVPVKIETGKTTVLHLDEAGGGALSR